MKDQETMKLLAKCNEFLFDHIEKLHDMRKSIDLELEAINRFQHEILTDDQF